MKFLLDLNEKVETLIEKTESGNRYFIEGKFLSADVPNKNGRVYPRKVMESAVEKYTKDYINENRALGELNHPSCFHEQTQILTTNGWKKIKDVVVGESVYTFNIETNQVEVKPVQEVHTPFYEGKMFEIVGRNFYTKVTPNHKFLLTTRYGKKYLLETDKIYDGYKNRKLSHDSLILIQDSEIVNEIDEISIGERTYNKNDLFSFLGIYYAEGCSQYKKNYKTCVSISQNEGWKADKIRDILKKLHSDIVWKEYKKLNEFGNLHITFQTSDNELSKYLEQFGNAYTKCLDRRLFECVDSYSAKLFIEGYMLGDGRCVLGEKYSQQDSFSVSKQLIDDISQIAFIAGIAVSFHEENHPDRFIGEREILSENTKTLHFCNFRNAKGKYIDNRFLTINEVDYSDNVYCITVENSTFYARDGNNTFWSGNSGPSVNLDKVCHVIESLEFRGSDVYGKARILSTPMGQIVKTLIDENVKLGVSSRGLGSLKKTSAGINEVQNDFFLAAVDVVNDPSGIGCFVNGITEDKEWKLINDEWHLVSSLPEVEPVSIYKKLEMFEQFLHSIK